MRVFKTWLAERLLAKAYRQLEYFDFEPARVVAQRLKRLQNTGYYEIEARALWGLDRRKEAIEVLERGVKQVPQLYILWDYLASYYSDEGWYDMAIDAYEKLISCAGGDHVLAKYNLALVYQRSTRHDRCIEILSSLDTRGKPYESSASASFAHSLSESGDPARAHQMMVEALESTGLYESDRNWLMCERAWAEWKLGDHDSALQHAYEAVHLDKATTRAKWLIREIASAKSPNAKLESHAEREAKARMGERGTSRDGIFHKLRRRR